ncbi:MAG: hypothetical protein CVU56_29120 [Deltaproteobacteria bacterium HGW-Deltaproteobacteria-14]|nr:MAG: hypothetical protein CVU56_29120 [Deltaproteobacteria bacterium HGW-Deltaproteobacteria-14]
MLRRARCALPALALALSTPGWAACDSAPGGTSDADVVTDTVADGGDGTGPDEGLGVDYSATSGGAVARYEPDGAGFTRTPWPSDRYRRADGTIDLSVMPNPIDSSFITDYLTYGSEAVDGYSRNGSVYFELSSLLDPASLPSDAAALTDPKALAQLVDVTAGDPAYGQRFPLVFQQTDGAGDPYYVGPTLAMRPVYGFPLADAHTYCALLTRALTDAGGAYLERAPAFAAALDDDPTLAPLRTWLAEAPIGRVDVAAATCFTTQDATRDMRRIQAYLDESATTPLFEVEYTGKTQYYYEVTAKYVAPNFQQGIKPYTDAGGDVVFDEAGQPVVQELETIRVRILIPRSFTMPADGWPVVLYSHGTGGSWQSCLDATNGDVPKDGLAMLCIDQPLHGIRGVGDDDNYLNSFNFLNPRSGRMSFRQAAADTIWLSHMVADGRFDLKADPDTWGKAVHLNPDKILFFGHSHGGLSGVIAFGTDPRLAGGVLSGASGVLIETILRRKDPLDIASLVAAVLGLDAAQLDTFHPIMTVAQTLVDVTDPVNYAPYWLSPVTGGRAKHVFMTEGTEDEASPSVGADAVAAAAGIPLIAPVEQLSRAHELRGLAAVTMPVSGNLVTATGARITGGLKQYAGGDHFVAFDDPGARLVWRNFLRGFRSLEVPVITQ